MSEDWIRARVQLVPGYELIAADGRAVDAVPEADVSFVGGFVRIRIPGTAVVQVVSAPAVRLITHPA